MFSKISSIVIFLSFLGITLGCQVGDVQSSSYSTTDGLVISETAYVVNFNVNCKDAAKPDSLVLYADIGNNKILPVAKSSDGSRFQVSWTADLAKSYSASYEIKIHDEEGLSNLKRAQRKESKEDVTPLFKINFSHPGTYRGPWLQTELIATVISILVWWVAYSHKSKLD
ncbi:translocon-associated protein subunit delta [Tetranychus urticae]|uniref:Translocon-associated protein subunit delta n=1 Tax=Tetranychus urticae TaxID=32264 RepID=T1K959_TETUR|nr:translocon-associated protein subunit delta [Tetranychus urticae]